MQEPVSNSHAPITAMLLSTFTTVTNSVSCQLELGISSDHSLKGWLHVGKRAYIIRGSVSKGNILYSFLLESFQDEPIALFRAEVRENELELELDTPNFYDLLQSNVTKLHLRRLKDSSPLSA